MLNFKNLALACVCAAVVFDGSPTQAGQVGPTSKLYLLNADPAQTLDTLQGTTFTQVPTHFGNPGAYEYALAVTSDVRTLGVNPGNPSAKYTLDCAFAGTTYNNGLPNSNGNAAYFDGTSDGTHNYTVEHNEGWVYQTDSDWSNPTLLFQLPGGMEADGIAYDSTNNSLWVAEYTGLVMNYTLDGNWLSSFSYAQIGRYGFLAYDPADNTLWANALDGGFVLEQYSKSGTLLQTVDFQAISGGDEHIYGGEFATAVPEPATLGLVGLSSLLVLRRKRGLYA